MSSSVEMMKFPIYGKIKAMFQTTNQIILYYVISIIIIHYNPLLTKINNYYILLPECRKNHDKPPIWELFYHQPVYFPIAYWSPGHPSSSRASNGSGRPDFFDAGSTFCGQRLGKRKENQPGNRHKAVGGTEMLSFFSKCNL
jgi:hypothetical protein